MVFSADKPYYRGDGKSLRFFVTPLQGTLYNAAYRFILAAVNPNGGGQTHLLTLHSQDMAIAIDPISKVATIEFDIPGSATAALPVARGGRELQWDFEVTPVNGQPKTLQGTMRVLPDTQAAQHLRGAIANPSSIRSAIAP